MNWKKRQKKKVGMWIAVICLMWCLFGCQNKVDIEDRNYVMSLGIQQIENIESVKERQKYQITYETADLTKTTEEGGGRQQGKAESLEGNSFDEVEKKQQKTDDKRLDYGHLKAILLKKDIWESENVDNILKELEQKKEIAGTTLVFIIEESPEKYMEIAKKKGSSLGEYLERMMANHKDVEEYTLSHLLREWSEGTLWKNKNDRHLDGKQIPYLRIQQEQIFLTYWNREETYNENGDTLSSGNFSQKVVAREVLRFHIRANSDSEEDQEVKLRIKDRMLPYLQQLFVNCSSKKECMEQAKNKIQEIEKTVKEACREEGQENLNPKAYLCRESFPLKEYGDLLLPSGTYDALRIDLGAAKGKNWWCMMYPSLCMIDGVLEEEDADKKSELEKLRSELKAEKISSGRAENQSAEPDEKKKSEKEEVHFRIKWKCMEWIEKLLGK